LKICILSPNFPPLKCGGAEIGAYELAEELSKRHHIIVLTKYNAPLAFNEKVGNFFIRRIKIIDKPILRFFTFILSSLVQIRSLKNIDVIQAQMIGYSSLTAILSKFLYNIPCIVWGRGSDVYQVKRSNVLIKILFKFIVSHANIVIALEENMKREIVRITKRKDYVIPDGINLERFHRKPASKHKINLMFIGRLHRVKGVKYLLNAMPLIRKKVKNVKLFIIGEGEEERSLKNFSEMLINSNKLKPSDIEFIGGVPHKDVPKYLQVADILILPSLSEGRPLVILEAMAMGVPVVATKVGGVALMIKHGETGLLISPKKPKEIAQAVIKILTSQSFSKMSEMAKMYAKKYDIKIIAKRVEKLYKLLRN